MYEDKLKSKETFLKKQVCCKYTDTKLMLLFNVISLEFNAPVPAFHKFFNSVRKKFFGCVFNRFCTALMTSSSDENLSLRASFFGPNIWKSDLTVSLFGVKWTKITPSISQKKCKHNLTGWWLTSEFLNHGWCWAFPSHTLSFTVRFVMMQPNFICGDYSL